MIFLLMIQQTEGSFGVGSFKWVVLWKFGVGSFIWVVLWIMKNDYENHCHFTPECITFFHLRGFMWKAQL